MAAPAASAGSSMAAMVVKTAEIFILWCVVTWAVVSVAGLGRLL